MKRLSDDNDLGPIMVSTITETVSIITETRPITTQAGAPSRADAETLAELTGTSRADDGKIMEIFGILQTFP